MKSIMEEASSISKAIEQAWHRAGNPAEFSIKVLETPERNLFGLTVKSAKIALFFDEQKTAAQFTSSIEKTPKPRRIEPKQPEEKQPAAPTKQLRRSRWNDEMIEIAVNWVKGTLQIMGLPNIQFTTSTSTNGLTFHFKTSVTGNEAKNRLLFSSFANLILTTLRHKYRRAFINLKVILITE